MGFPLILAAIILDIPNKEWFTGQWGIADALLWIGIVLTVLHLVFFAVIAIAATSRKI